jgi:hypothetical protein
MREYPTDRVWLELNLGEIMIETAFSIPQLGQMDV